MLWVWTSQTPLSWVLNTFLVAYYRICKSVSRGGQSHVPHKNCSASKTPKHSRRELLANVAPAALAVAALPTLASAATTVGNHQALIAEIRHLYAKHQAAISHEMSIEVRKGEPGYAAYEAAVAAAEAAGAEMKALAEHVLEQPVRSWGDVAVRAELAKAYAERTVADGLCLVEEPVDWGEATLGALLDAALTIGGAHVQA